MYPHRIDTAEIPLCYSGRTPHNYIITQEIIMEISKKIQGKKPLIPLGATGRGNLSCFARQT